MHRRLAVRLRPTPTPVPVLLALLVLLLAPVGAGAQAPDPAWSPDPPDSASGVSILTTLTWTAGVGATSHDVLVDGGFRGNQPGSTYDPGPLAFGTTYTWRIDEVNGSGTTTGRVWCFTTEPDPAATRVTFIDPPPGSTLTGTTATFTWDLHGLAVVDSWLYVGPEPGSYLYYDSYEGTDVFDTVLELPSDGADIWVRLEYEVAGEPCCRWDDARYPATTLSPAMVSPAPGSVLPPGPVTFTWDAFGAPVTSWYFESGYIHGGYDYEESGTLAAATTSWDAIWLPEDGGLVWVRLWFTIGGEESFKDYVYQAATGTDLIRGPYLQNLSDSRVVIRWRTKTATDSLVAYGPTPISLTESVADPSLTTEHDIVLDGLEPNRIYYYAVGSSSTILAGNDPNHRFETAPPLGVARPTTVWVLGDSGAGADSQSGLGGDRARQVRDAYLDFIGGGAADLVLMLGDNAYFDGTDREFQKGVFEMYPSVLRNASVWPAIGNHEAELGVYRATFDLPAYAEAGGLPSGTESYYSFDRGNIHFICLDSMYSDRSPTGAMMTWLTADVAATLQHWIIAYWHHPPYSKGSHDSDFDSRQTDMRAIALPILEDYGVDLVLSGHSHSYERSFLLDGHYGTSGTLLPAMVKDSGNGRETGDGAYTKVAATAHAGAVYVVAGSSSTTSGAGSLNHPAMYVGVKALGSVVLAVDGDRLHASFVRETGAIDDEFTLIKPLPPCVGPPGPIRGVMGVRRNGDVAFRWDVDPVATGGYRLYRTTRKQLVPSARAHTAGVDRAGETDLDSDDAAVVDPGAVTASEGYFYQVVGLCGDGANEGPN